MVFFVAGLNLVYQFWIHTEVIGRMPRWFEAVMNTPLAPPRPPRDQSALSRPNYAGVFIVWDNWLGTFEPERDDDRPRYGIVKDLGSFNILWAAYHEWVGIAEGRLARAQLEVAGSANMVAGRRAGARRQPRHRRP